MAEARKQLITQTLWFQRLQGGADAVRFFALVFVDRKWPSGPASILRLIATVNFTTTQSTPTEDPAGKPEHFVRRIDKGTVHAAGTSPSSRI